MHDWILRLGGLLFSPHLLLGLCSAEQLAVGVFLVGATRFQSSLSSGRMRTLVLPCACSLSGMTYDLDLLVVFPTTQLNDFIFGLSRLRLAPNDSQGSGTSSPRLLHRFDACASELHCF